MTPQAEMAEPAVEEKIAVAAADMPDVAAVEGLDPGFVDQRHVVGHADGFIPAFGLDRLHVSIGHFAQHDQDLRYGSRG